MKSFSKTKGFTLIELLVVIAIIALLSSVITAALAKTRLKARDSARIQNARQLAIALEEYEQSNNSYKISNAGYNNDGSGYVSKGSETPGYTNSIITTLKNAGFYNSSELIDPIYGTDNYYLGVCTSTDAYNVFVKLEQTDLTQAPAVFSNACGGTEATALGFNYVASTVGGTSGGQLAGGSETSGGGSSPFTCGVSTVTGPDGLTYGTVTAEDNRCWLDRDLGATRVATSYNDYQSYGSKFQWGRLTDGHQLIEYTSSLSGSAMYSDTTSLSVTDIPVNNLFIKNTVSPYDWRVTQNNNLWNISTGLNNPCPSNFHVPTQAEWSSWYGSISSFSACVGLNSCMDIAYNSSLKLNASGFRNYSNSAMINIGSFMFYWSSSSDSTHSNFVRITSSSINQAATTFRSNGLSVRCIMN